MFSQEKVLSFWDHLEELRTVLFKSIGIIFLCSLVTFTFSAKIIQLLSDTLPPQGAMLTPSVPPLTASPQTARFLLLSPAEGFITSLKLSLWLSISFTAPIWGYLFLSFFSPALTPRLRKNLLPLLMLSIGFFILGSLFGYLVSLPTANNFFFSFNNEIGVNFWSLSLYLDYSLFLCLAHGISFEIIFLLLLCVAWGVVSYQQLKKARPYCIVGSFVIGAALTPPDIITQCILAIPLVFFYEIALFWARTRRKKDL